MKRYIIYENGEGWLVYDRDADRVTRCTLDILEATEMSYREALIWVGYKTRYGQRFMMPSIPTTTRILGLLEEQG